MASCSCNCRNASSISVAHCFSTVTSGLVKREEFLQHYHKRSNVETTFHMIKAKFGDSLRSKTDRALINEALCKILCHNIVVLVHEIHELGIEPIFGAESPAAQQVVDSEV